MDQFFARLRQRKIVQWALAYIAAAFALIQVIDIVAQRFGWPEDTVRFVIVVLAIGFFVVLVLAWYHGERGAQRIAGVELLMLMLLFAIGGGLLWRVAQHTHDMSSESLSAKPASVRASTHWQQNDSSPISDKSIAVLPFENLSDEKSNAYFAEGMQDEILTKLSKLSALRVLSRTSTQRFAANKKRNIGQIALELRVANVLEGSVQKAGNAVHINVQLVEAATDKHLWAESYNRTLDDIFGVEGEVAQAVADALKATLTAAERQVIAAKGTENPKAYEAYLRGRASDNQGYSFIGTEKAVDNYLLATREDPNFAQAWAAAAVAMANLYFNGYDTHRSTAAAVRNAADTATRLQPDLAESVWAQGGYNYWVKRDYRTALALFKRALAKQPGDIDTLSALFFIERRLGLWDDAIAHYREAIEREPRNVSVLVQGAFEIFFRLRRYDETREFLQRALKIAPEDTTARACLAQIEQHLGRLDAADGWLAGVPTDSGDYYESVAHIEQLTYRRDEAALNALTAVSQGREGAGLTNADYIGLTRLGFLRRASGLTSSATKIFERLAKAIASQPGGIDHVTDLASIGPLVLAGLGDYVKAISAAQHQIDLNRDDTLELARTKTALAQILALKGDRDAAIALLPELLDMPEGPTPALLALDPMWDPLRDDPRFIALTKRPLAAYKSATHK